MFKGFSSMSSPKIQCHVNGESHSFDHALTVGALVINLALDMRKVAIERNREIVPRTQYEHTMIQDGDQIEIVQFIGGG